MVGSDIAGIHRVAPAQRSEANRAPRRRRQAAAAADDTLTTRFLGLDAGALIVASCNIRGATIVC